MALTVLEATKLDTFKTFRLVAGHRGLDNPVEKIGILDWEYINKKEGGFVGGDFVRGELVLTSLLFAKNDPSLILEAVKYLEDGKVSGLAIKTVYYNELPEEVIRYANENSFPIFLFHTVYFEDIITDIMDKVRSIDNNELLESKVDLLIKMNLNKAIIRDIALEINSSFKEYHCVIYLKDRKGIPEAKTLSIIDQIKKEYGIHLYETIMKYQNGILFIATFEKLEQTAFRSKVDSLLRSIGIDPSEYCIGVSSLHSRLSELGNGINESLYSEKAGEVSGSYFNYFNDIGVYSILIPHCNDLWFRHFYSSIIDPIISYDEKYNTELFDTAMKFVENDGIIMKTAEALFLHKNTIRYRINKIKELLQMEGMELHFYEQLSIAVKLYKIYNI